MNHHIRPVRATDIPQIAAIERIVFPGDAWTQEVLRLSADNERIVFLVAEKGADDGYPVAGYIVLSIVADTGNIDNVCVAQEERRQGIARTLLVKAMEEARKEYGVTMFTLETRISNTAARALYEAEGFVCEGIRPGFYSAPREDAAIYWKR